MVEADECKKRRYAAVVGDAARLENQRLTGLSR